MRSSSRNKCIVRCIAAGYVTILSEDGRGSWLAEGVNVFSFGKDQGEVIALWTLTRHLMQGTIYHAYMHSSPGFGEFNALSVMCSHMYSGAPGL